MPMADTPIACTLSSDALQQRLQWIRRVAAENLIGHRLAGNALHLTYRREAKPELEKIVLVEKQCCAYLRFSIRDLSDGVELEIQAPESAGHDTLSLFEHFLPSARQVAAQKACGCPRGACG